MSPWYVYILVAVAIVSHCAVAESDGETGDSHITTTTMGHAATTQCLIQAADVRVEGLAQRFAGDLVAIGTSTPLFSWQVALTAFAPADTKNQTQGSYRIVAKDASSAEVLWDSGVIESSDTLEILWAGKPLNSRQQVAVALILTDGAGNGECGVSAPLEFEVGLLEQADWSAEWIGRDPNTPKTDCETFSDSPTPRLRIQFAAPKPGLSVVSARLYGTGLGYYKFFLDGNRVGDAALEPSFTAFGTRVHYTVYNASAHLSTADGPHVLGVELGNGWWNPASLKFWGHLDWRTGMAAIGVPMVVAQLEIQYDDNSMQTISTTNVTTWKVGSSPTLFNNVYLGEKYDARLEDDTWLNAGFDDSKWATPLSYCRGSVTGSSAPAVPTHHTASLAGPPFCGVSGANPAPNPGQEAYETITLQCTAVGATIEHIDFAQFGMPTGQCGSWGPGPCGSAATVAKWVTTSCVGKASCLLDPRSALGDTCPDHAKQFAVTAVCSAGEGNATVHRGGPPSPGPPAPPPPPPQGGLPGPLQVSPLPPVRAQKIMAPVGIHESTPGSGDNPGNATATVRIFDIGANIAGVCRITFGGATRTPGSTISIRYGELLRPDGTLNAMTSVAGQIKNGAPAKECPGTNAPPIAFQEDTYIVKGGATPESWQPSYCWHAFRYAAVATPPGVEPPTADDITCWPLRTDAPIVSLYDTSAEPLLGRITQMTRRTFENNMMSVQSDCPHRERLGYGGDALASGEAGLSIFDWRTFYRKRVVDYTDAQRDNGGFTETAPFVGMSDAGLGDGTGPIGWETFQPVAMLWLYKYYGEVAVLKANWPALKRFIALLDTDPPGVDSGLGDWMPVEKSQVQMTGEGFRRMSYVAAANISKILGEPVAEQTKYLAKVSAIDANFTTRFGGANGTYAQAGRTATQCGQSMPLFMGMVPSAQKKPAMAQLLDTVTAANGSMLVGMFGIKWFLMALAENDAVDLAYDSIATTTYPSYGYMLENNATTMWESWFFSDNTFSHDHPMFGSVETFMMQGLGGIQPHPAARGFDVVLIKPRPPKKLAHFTARFMSVRGLISVSWSWATRDDAKGDKTRALDLVVVIPPNVVADIHIPTSPRTLVREGLNKDVVATAAVDATSTIVSRGSGTHMFYSVV